MLETGFLALLYNMERGINNKVWKPVSHPRSLSRRDLACPLCCTVQLVAAGIEWRISVKPVTWCRQNAFCTAMLALLKSGNRFLCGNHLYNTAHLSVQHCTPLFCTATLSLLQSGMRFLWQPTVQDCTPLGAATRTRKQRRAGRGLHLLYINIHI